MQCILHCSGLAKTTFLKMRQNPAPPSSQCVIKCFSANWELGFSLATIFHSFQNSNFVCLIIYFFLNRLIGVQHVSENDQPGLFIYLFSKWPGGGEEKGKTGILFCSAASQAGDSAACVNPAAQGWKRHTPLHSGLRWSLCLVYFSSQNFCR